MVYLKHMVTSYESYYVKQISPIDEMTSNDYGNGPSQNYLKDFKNNHQNILKKEFDSYGIWCYPSEEKANIKNKELAKGRPGFNKKEESIQPFKTVVTVSKNQNNQLLREVEELKTRKKQSAPGLRAAKCNQCGMDRKYLKKGERCCS